jgi:hypothetical protein
MANVFVKYCSIAYMMIPQPEQPCNFSLNKGTNPFRAWDFDLEAAIAYAPSHVHELTWVIDGILGWQEMCLNGIDEIYLESPDRDALATLVYGASEGIEISSAGVTYRPSYQLDRTSRNVSIGRRTSTHMLLVLHPHQTI